MYKKVIGAQGSEITLLPGYYWARYVYSKPEEPWLIVEIVEIEDDKGNYTEPYICGDDVGHPFRQFVKWYGPLVCPFY